MKLLGILLLGAVLSGCSTLQSLMPCSLTEKFELNEDLLIEEGQGPLASQWVFGLKAGTYCSMGEDEEGRYFTGDGQSVMVLMGEYAAQYLAASDSERAKIPEKYSLGHVGGVWVPNDRDKPMQFFYVVDQKSGSKSQIEQALLAGEMVRISVTDASACAQLKERVKL